MGPSHHQYCQQVQSDQVTRLLGLIDRFWYEVFGYDSGSWVDSCLALIDLLDSGRYLGALGVAAAEEDRGASYFLFNRSEEGG